MTETTTPLVDRCHTLRAAHVRGRPVVLPNAWDAASARVVEEAGFAAVATTSGGVAAALGFRDHEGAPVEAMLGAAARIVTAVDVPVTVDFESGYGFSAQELVERLRAIGAAGINLEDTDHRTGALVPVDRQTDRLASVRAAAEELRYPLVLNARIDVFLQERGRPQAELTEPCVERGRAYLSAGADCVYPILLDESEALRDVLARLDGPVNVLASAGTDIAGLAAQGVARVSYGSSLHQRTMRSFAEHLRDLAR